MSASLTSAGASPPSDADLQVRVLAQLAKQAVAMGIDYKSLGIGFWA